MLEVYYRPTAELTIKVEAKDLDDVFKLIGPVQEVLGNNTVCGKCGGTKIRMVHRKADGKYDVYELACEKCGAKLALGKNEMGNLFPRRYPQEKIDGSWKPKLDADGKKVWLPNNGWVKWDNKTNSYV